MSFPRYPEYKDSGVEWLGEVPGHWEVSTLSRISLERCDGPFGSGIKSDDYTESGALVIRLQNIKSSGFSRGEPAYLDLEYFNAELARHNVAPNDVLVAGLGDENNIVGRACVAPDWIGPALVKADCFRFRLDGTVALPGFVAAQLNASSSCDSGRMSTGSTRSRIPLSVMSTRRVALPPVTEQVQITNFLDRETAKIDALVAEQQSLIALLKEKRQALISHAVTKGLNPDVPMKDSGVAWLGEVPTHWEVVTFQRVVYVAEGQVDPEQDPYRSMVLIAPNHVESGTGRLLFLETAEEQSAESGKYLCEPGDVIYSKIRPALRKACLAPSRCLCSADMYPLRGDDRLANVFLYWFVLSEQFSMLSVLESDRVAMPKVNREALKAVQLPLPPKGEQMSIAAFLEKATAGIDALVMEADSTIKLLQERRTALISAAVAGRIDVRTLSTHAIAEEYA